MSKDRRDNQNYDKNEVKSRREKNKEKRKEKREQKFQEKTNSNYRRKKQHDAEESMWDF